MKRNGITILSRAKRQTLPLWVAFALILSALSVRAETLCIAPLSNHTADKKWDAVAIGFSDLLAMQLARHNNIRVVERERLMELLKEQTIALRGLQSPQTAIQVGRLLAADRLVTGGLLQSDNQLTIVVHVFDIGSSRLVTSIRETDTPEHLLPLSLRLAERIRQTLHVELAPVDPHNTDPNPMANLHFMRGLGLYYGGNRDRAIVAFMKTHQLDPQHHQSVYFMALSYFEEQEYAHAKIEFERYLRLAPAGRYAMQSRDLLRRCHAALKRY